MQSLHDSNVSKSLPTYYFLHLFGPSLFIHLTSNLLSLFVLLISLFIAHFILVLKEGKGIESLQPALQERTAGQDVAV